MTLTAETAPTPPAPTPIVITRAYPDDNPTNPSTSDTDDQPAAPGTAQ